MSFPIPPSVLAQFILKVTTILSNCHLLAVLLSSKDKQLLKLQDKSLTKDFVSKYIFNSIYKLGKEQKEINNILNNKELNDIFTDESQIDKRSRFKIFIGQVLLLHSDLLDKILSIGKINMEKKKFITQFIDFSSSLISDEKLNLINNSEDVYVVIIKFATMILITTIQDFNWIDKEEDSTSVYDNYVKEISDMLKYKPFNNIDKDDKKNNKRNRPYDKDNKDDKSNKKPRI
jgi:hypothetical protein